MLTRLVASNFSDTLDHCTNVRFGHAPKANHGTGGVGEANNAGTSPTSSTYWSAQVRFVVNQLAGLYNVGSVKKAPHDIKSQVFVCQSKKGSVPAWILFHVLVKRDEGIFGFSQLLRGVLLQNLQD